MTLTSLTGALAVSMICDCVVDGNRSFRGELCGGWSMRRCGFSMAEIQHPGGLSRHGPPPSAKRMRQDLTLGNPS